MYMLPFLLRMIRVYNGALAFLVMNADPSTSNLSLWIIHRRKRTVTVNENVNHLDAYHFDCTRSY